MKAATLQARIEKRLFTKSGKLVVKYEKVIELLRHPKSTVYPARWSGSFRHMHLTDHSDHYEEALTLLGIDFETGNDAPRGGAEGKFIRLSAKGIRQTNSFAEQFEANN